MLRDILLAIRTLRRSPLFVTLATLLLAIGVGANTGIFSLANWALLRPAPGVDRPDELVLVSARRTESPGPVPLSHPAVVRMIEPGPATTGGAAFRHMPVDVVRTPGEAAVREAAQVVTPGFFAVLGVAMHFGRAFEPDEGSATTAHTVAILGHRYWRDTFGGDPTILGRSLQINGRTFTIVGVASSEFNGPNLTDRVALWLPSSSLTALMPRMPANVLSMERAPIWPWLMVRRTPGATPADVAAQAQGAEPALAEAGVVLDVSDRVGLPPSLRENLGARLVIVGGLVGLLLLLTAANLANLLLSRASRRRHEVAVRRALGASSRRITWDLVAEGTVLSLCGTVAAVGTSVVAVRLLEGRSLVLGFEQTGGVPVDARVLAFAATTAFAATLLASLGAALLIRRFAATDMLRTRGGASVAARRVRAGLVAAQIATSLALVVGAGLALRSLSNIQHRDLGYDPENVLMYSLNPGVQGYDDAASDALFRSLLLELQDEAFVEAAGFTWLAPLGGQRYSEQVVGIGGTAPEAVVAHANMITPGFVGALGMQLIEGRTFDEREYGRAVRPARGAVVLNETLARTLFGEGPFTGREIRMEGRQESAFEVIGVVRDARIVALQGQPGPALYDPFGNGYATTSSTFLLRTAEAPDVVIARVREILLRRDPELPLLDAEPLVDTISGALLEERLLARVTSVFALLSVVLAALGLFGLVSESVHARAQEFGVRSALGARGRHLLALVLRDSLSMAAFGVAAGILLGFLVERLMRARLFDAAGMDLVALGGAAILLAAVTLLASIGPAARASRADPMEAIRAE